jgi:hypothetical protein
MSFSFFFLYLDSAWVEWFLLYVCMNSVKSVRCRLSLVLSIFFVLIAWYFFCCVCMGVVWQFSKLGLGVSGPGFDASPYLMPLLGFRLFSSPHVLAFRMNGLFFIGEFDELVLAVVLPTSLGLETAVLAMARFTFAEARAVVLAVAGGVLAGLSAVM